jgi:hypothetical protein
MSTSESDAPVDRDREPLSLAEEIAAEVHDGIDVSDCVGDCVADVHHPYIKLYR